MVRLHLGCGRNKLDGWVNIDAVQDCAPDVCHDITKPLTYADQSVDEILAEDLLEHFDKYMRFIIFEDWARVLKIDGKITLQVPNFKKMLMRFFKYGFENFIDMIFGENMLRSEVYLGHFGNHKWAYSPKSLSAFVRHFGLEPLEIRAKGLNIRMVAVKKRHIPRTELDKLRVYSHANRCGIGTAYLPLEVIREKIKIFEENRS